MSKCSAMCLQLISKTILICLFVSANVNAEIYKWTDENGKVHFSDKKPVAKQSKAEEVKISSSVNSIPRVNASQTISDKEKEKILKQRLRQWFAEGDNKADAQAPRQVRAQDDNVDPRCRLARNILNGDVVLSNGLDIGKHEIEVAKRDVRKFCK